MTIPRLATMTRYWKRQPPLHVLVASYLGYEPKEDKPKGEQPKAMSTDAMAGVMAAFPQVKR